MIITNSRDAAIACVSPTSGLRLGCVSSASCPILHHVVARTNNARIWKFFFSISRIIGPFPSKQLDCSSFSHWFSFSPGAISRDSQKQPLCSQNSFYVLIERAAHVHWLAAITWRLHRRKKNDKTFYFESFTSIISDYATLTVSSVNRTNTTRKSITRCHL